MRNAVHDLAVLVALGIALTPTLSHRERDPSSFPIEGEG